jgi:hypothetical protein
MKLFVHIPKTAGTSFRIAAESRFGHSRILRDYGTHSDATSDLIREKVYGSKDIIDFEKILPKVKPMLIAGHFPLSKYGGIIGLTNTVTIIRDPIQQVISHYRHNVRDHGLQHDLMTFARLDRVRNLQTRMLANTDPALVGIVGLTEQYKEFLSVVNHRWQWNLKNRKRNVSERFRKNPIQLTREQKFELERLNQSDLTVYERAQQVFENTLYCMQKGLQADPRGAITIADTVHGLRGWAFDMVSDDIAEIEILVNGNSKLTTRCDIFTPALAGWKIPRRGYVGFAYQRNSLKEGDIVEIRDIRYGVKLAASEVGSPD